MNGGVIGKDNPPSKSSASGIWTINEVREARLMDSWPVLASAPGRLVMLYDGSTAGTYVYDTEATSWEPEPPSGRLLQSCRRGVLTNTGAAVVVAGLYSDTSVNIGIAFRSTDKGINWSDLGTFSLENPSSYLAIGSGEGKIVVAGHSSITVSNDDGVTWDPIPDIGTVLASTSLRPYDVARHPISGTWLVTFATKALRSFDGMIWEPVMDGANIAGRSILPTEDGFAVTTTSGHIKMFDSEATSYTTVPSPNMTWLRNLDGIYVGTEYAYGVLDIQYSTDLVNWTPYRVGRYLTGAARVNDDIYISYASGTRGIVRTTTTFEPPILWTAINRQIATLVLVP